MLGDLPPLQTWAWLAHLGASLYMTGIIWFVQVVHYPLMDRVPAAGYPAFEAAHMRYTTWVVAPAMLLELATGLLLWYWGILPELPAILNLALIGLLWASTFLVQAPTHQRLVAGFDPVLHRRLLRSNWLRTALWTVKALLLLILLARSVE